MKETKQEWTLSILTGAAVLFLLTASPAASRSSWHRLRKMRSSITQSGKTTVSSSGFGAPPVAMAIAIGNKAAAAALTHTLVFGGGTSGGGGRKGDRLNIIPSHWATDPSREIN